VEFVVLAKFNQGGTSIGKSAEFLAEDAFDFALVGEEQELLEIVWGFAGGGESINYLFVGTILKCGN